MMGLFGAAAGVLLAALVVLYLLARSPRRRPAVAQIFVFIVLRAWPKDHMRRREHADNFRWEISPAARMGAVRETLGAREILGGLGARAQAVRVRTRVLMVVATLTVAAMARSSSMAAVVLFVVGGTTGLTLVMHIKWNTWSWPTRWKALGWVPAAYWLIAIIAHAVIWNPRPTTTSQYAQTSTTTSMYNFSVVDVVTLAVMGCVLLGYFFAAIADRFEQQQRADTQRIYGEPVRRPVFSPVVAGATAFVSGSALTIWSVTYLQAHWAVAPSIGAPAQQAQDLAAQIMILIGVAFLPFVLGPTVWAVQAHRSRRARLQYDRSVHRQETAHNHTTTVFN